MLSLVRVGMLPPSDKSLQLTLLDALNSWSIWVKSPDDITWVNSKILLFDDTTILIAIRHLLYIHQAYDLLLCVWVKTRQNLPTFINLRIISILPSYTQGHKSLKHLDENIKPQQKYWI